MGVKGKAETEAYLNKSSTVEVVWWFAVLVLGTKHYMRKKQAGFRARLWHKRWCML